MKKYLVLSIVTLCSISCSGNSNKKDTKNNKENAAKRDKKNMSDTMQTTNSGLKFQVLQEPAADARAPKRGQQVVVHYTGWLEKDGGPDLTRKFDSSVDRGEKFTFVIGVGQVIKGWDEGVMAMKIGEKRRLVIPSDLGYGAYGAGRVIPANATLVFDVELFDIK